MKDFTKGNEAKLIFYFTVPMLIGNILQQTYTIADSIIVGRALGKTALGAIGVTTPITFFILSLILGITTGSTILIGQYYGAKDMKNIRKTVDTSFIFIMLSAAVLGILGWLFSRSILLLIGTPANILAQATVFLRISFLGLPLVFGYNITGAMLRGVGDSKTPLYFLIFSSIVNIGLAALFVLVLGLGIAGSAFGTLIAQGTSFVCCLIYINKKNPLLRLNYRKLDFDRTILKQILKIGLPNGIQYLLVSLSQMFVQSVTNSFGTEAVTAIGAAARIDSIGTLPAISFSAAMSGFVAQNLGAGNHERVKKGYRAALLMSSAMVVVIALSVYLFRGRIMGMFVSDSAVIASGMQYLGITSLFYIFPTIQFITYGVIRGSGDSVIPMLISVGTLWLIRLPIAWLMAPALGAGSISWSQGAAWAIGFVCAYSYYMTGRWRNKVVIKKAAAQKG